MRKATAKVIALVTPGKPEQRAGEGEGAKPITVHPAPKVRFDWGSFRFDGYVDSIEESLEHFSADGRPLRSSIQLALSTQEIQHAFDDKFKARPAGAPSPGAAGIGSGFTASAGIGVERDRAGASPTAPASAAAGSRSRPPTGSRTRACSRPAPSSTSGSGCADADRRQRGQRGRGAAARARPGPRRAAGRSRPPRRSPTPPSATGSASPTCRSASVPTDQAIVAARPEVRVDGKTIDDLTNGLEVMRIHEGRETPATLELEVGNWGTPAAGGTPDFRFLDRRQLDFGKRIEVAFGSTHDLPRAASPGLEVVFPRSGVPGLVVLAEDELQVLRLARRTRTFENVKRRGRRAHGGERPQPHADRSTCPARRTRCVAQLDQSDLAFLRDRVRAVGGELWVRDGELHAAQRTVARPAAAARPSCASTRRSASCACAPTSPTRRPRSSSAAGTSPAAAAIAERAGDAVLGAESQGGDTGATILRAGVRRPRPDRGRRRSRRAPARRRPAPPRSSARAPAASCAARRCASSSGDALRRAAASRSRAPARRSAATTRSIDVVHRFDAVAGARSELMFERAVLKGSGP